MKSDKVRSAAVELFAAKSHDAWRRQFHRAHPEQKALPRMRLRGGQLVDVNQPWSKLHPKAKADNLKAGRDALEAITKHPKDSEAAAAYVHVCWVKRNRRDPNQPKALFCPYQDLPEDEKDKDRAHIKAIKAALAATRGVRRVAGNTSVKRAAVKQRTRAGSANRSITIDAKTWRRLEATAKRLSAALGKRVSPQSLAQSGLMVSLTLYDALA